MSIDVNQERLIAIKKLVEFSEDIRIISERLKFFNWDYAGQGVPLTRKNLIKTLQRFLDDEINMRTVEEWANLIECREDIEFDSAIISEIIYELANPYLTQPLNKVRASELLFNLQENSF